MPADVQVAPLRQGLPLHEAPASRLRLHVGRAITPLPAEPPDDLRAATGVLVSVLIGAALWIAILAGAWLIAR